MNNLPCPKCKSTTTWFEPTDRELVLRCSCGLHKIMARTLDSGIRIEHAITEVGQVTLPRSDTKQARCLGALASLREGTTEQVVMVLSGRGACFSMDEVATLLTVLRCRGLVVVLESRRGISGGSVWGLTDAAKHLLKLT